MADTTVSTDSVATSIKSALKVGSGVDVVSMARALTDAEEVPKTEGIQAKIDATEAKISAYSVVSYQLGILQASFEALNDANELATSTGTSSDNETVSFSSVEGTADEGTYAITISQLAQEQMTTSDEYSATTTALNSGSPFTLSIAIGSSSTTATSITVSTDTPAGVVAAINSANIGVSASLIDTGTSGTNQRIILKGDSGSEGLFSVTSSVDMGFGTAGNTLQAAQNSIMTLNGLTVTRDSNQVSDVIAGATLSLNATTNSDIRLSVVKDTTTLKTKVQTMVESYNTFNDLMIELTSSDVNEDDELVGSLSRDRSTTRYISDQVYNAIFADSSTTSGDIDALRDIGISVDITGNLTFDETDFDVAVTDNFDDVVMMLSANTSDQSLFDGQGQGLSQDVATIIGAVISSSGILADQDKNADQYLLDYKDELSALKLRMESLYDRYLTQFTAMDSLVNSLNSTGDYMEAQLEGIAKAYDN
jgi:flagellar hook-associated protein 2|tara:strand:+ start:4203 stop:5642 length:1440 start_codon:yes stop_codon:yes gene_type:complete